MRHIILLLALVMVMNGTGEAIASAKDAPLPELKELKLQRSTYPATLTGDCAYIDEKYTMDCSFFVSRVAARKSDGRVNDMLLRMYKDRSAEEWQDHPICTASEVKDLERHIRLMKMQKNISDIEEVMIRREFEPAVAFCADPTLEKYKTYLEALASEVSCSISTTTERVKLSFDKEGQSWSGLFAPKSERKPVTEYLVKLDSVTGQVGQRLIFMVTQTLRPRGGGRPQQLIYRAKRSDQKHFCGYVEW